MARYEDNIIDLKNINFEYRVLTQDEYIKYDVEGCIGYLDKVSNFKESKFLIIDNSEVKDIRTKDGNLIVKGRTSRQAHHYTSASKDMCKIMIADYYRFIEDDIGINEFMITRY